MKNLMSLNVISSFTRKESVSTYLLYGIVLLIVGTLIYVIRPYPVDDFLRHIRYIDYKPLGGYAFMFPHSYFETFRFNPWYGFDLIAGILKNAVGPDRTVIAYEIAFTCIFIAAMLFNLRTSRKSSLFPVTLIILFIFLSYGFYRIGLIRPAILISAFLLFGIPGRRFVPGVILAIVSAFFYWLFWLYMVPLSAAHYIKGSKRFAGGVFIGTVISLLSWGILTDFEYFRVVPHIFLTLVSGRDNIIINENVLSLGKLATPVIFLSVACFVFTAKVRRKTDLVFMLIIFTLPLAIQVRYFLDVSLPLIFIYTVNNNLDLIETFSDRVRPAIEAFGIISMVLIVPPLLDRSVEGEKAYTLTDPGLSVGSVVFTEGLPANFHLIFYNREPVRVIPSAEIGWNDALTKKLLKDLSDKPVLDDKICPYLQAYGVNYVVSEKDSIARCLQREKVLFTGAGRKISLWRSR